MNSLEGEMENLTKEVLDLIESKREGSYWDFKREWYKKEKIDDLLLDIICMSNNLVDRDCYIIIGVDEESDCEIKNVSGDKNRKNTQNLADFLKDKPFAGNVRPNVYVRTLKLGKDEVDVIIIKNGYHTPYYLTEKFRSLFPNSIYVRVEDTNTSRDKSADIGNIEYLWKKRFRIDKPPIERVEYFLKDKKQWDSFDKGEIYGYYFRLYPEYNICKKISEDRTGYEFYLFTQMDSRPHWYEVSILYNQTEIWTGVGIALDGGRAFTNVPETGYIKVEQEIILYNYYIENTLTYEMHNFFLDEHSYEAIWAIEQFMKCVLVFKCEKEKVEFEKHISLLEYRKIDFERYEHHMRYVPDIDGYVEGAFKKEYRDALFLKDELIQYRNKKSKDLGK